MVSFPSKCPNTAVRMPPIPLSLPRSPHSPPARSNLPVFLSPPSADYNPNVYTDTGLSTKFLVAEYVLGTVMEFCACCLLLSTYFAGVVGGERMEEVGRERDAEEDDGAGEEMQLNDRVKGV